VRLHIAVVCLDSVDNCLRLTVLAGNVNTDGHMAALNLMVDGLAKVMEKTGALCSVHVSAQLRCQKSRNVGDLNGVIQHVLTVAGTVLHAAQKLDDFRVETVDIGLKHSSLALGLDGCVDFLLCLCHHFLNAGGVIRPS